MVVIIRKKYTINVDKHGNRILGIDIKRFTPIFQKLISLKFRLGPRRFLILLKIKTTLLLDFNYYNKIKNLTNNVCTVWKCVCRISMI